MDCCVFILPLSTQSSGKGPRASPAHSASVAHAALGVCVADKPENSQETGYQGMQSKSIGSPQYWTLPSSIISLSTNTCHGLLSPEGL